ncbi:MAG TPA: outer membrane beta-barrel protein [Longimicrobiales bacterium]|nr:outer membrane beta-barrel protein [Longimicrobiales bacterium]
MRRLTTAILGVAFLVFAAPAAAQTFGFGVHAGVSLPMGDYADTDTQESGAAELGFMGGVDLFFPLGMAPGLSWLTSVSAVAHSVDGDVFAGTGIDVTGGYLLFPVMTGLRFDIPAGPLGLFVQGQAGIVLAKGPSFSSSLGSANSEWGSKFGFNIGAGAQVSQNIYAGLRYFPLGDTKLKYEEAPDGVDQNISFLDIFVGFAVR